MEKSKIVYLVLKDLYNGKILSHQELGINKKEYAEVLEAMQKKSLITDVGITYLDKDKLLINNQNEKITVAGVNYLMENTIPDREYKLRVSIDEAVNGIELTAAADIKDRTYKYKKIFTKPLSEIDVETEAFILLAEGLKRDKESRKHAV
jgi:hypothetical protein